MTMISVPNQPREGRTARGVRIDDADWNDLGDIADALERDRGWVIRKLIAWYLRRPGADLPGRDVEQSGR